MSVPTDIVDQNPADNAVARTLTQTHDRCDRCRAQAYVETTMPSGATLLWCGHHFAKYEEALFIQGSRITADARADLAVKRESSANA